MTGETQAAVPEVMRRRRTTMGVVISDKMDKTVVVAVERRVSHPRYDRVVKRTSKFYAHDDTNSCKVGDVVTLVETRPMSRLKRWRVRSVLREGKRVERVRAEIPGLAAEDTGRPKRKRRTAKDAPGGGTSRGGGKTSGEVK
jgi:small subunit ribosomal protein S17